MIKRQPARLSSSWDICRKAGFVVIANNLISFSGTACLSAKKLTCEWIMGRPSCRFHFATPTRFQKLVCVQIAVQKKNKHKHKSCVEETFQGWRGEGGVKAEMGRGRVIKCEHGEGLGGKSLCYVRVGRGEGLKVDRGLKTSRRW